MLDVNEPRSPGTQKMALQSAILIYAGHHRHGEETAMATFHEVDQINGRPEIMPGRLLNLKDLESIQKTLGSPIETDGWLDENILCKEHDRIIWWTPPQVKPMFFDASVSQTSKEQVIVGQAMCPVPGLVWMARPGVGLHLFACKGKERPQRDTQLYQAPLFNVYKSGAVCLGNAQVSKDQQRIPAAWVEKLFLSHWTHPNIHEPDRLLLGVNPMEFWAEMLKAPTDTFPEDRLVPVDIKAVDLTSNTVNKILGNL